MNTIPRSTIGVCALCVAILLGASAGALRAADGSATAAGDVTPVRNKNFRVQHERTTITKDSPQGDYTDTFWVTFMNETVEKQLNAEGRGDGNSFKLFPKSAGAKDLDFRFCYRFDDTKGTAVLRIIGGNGGLAREFQTSIKYPTGDALDKMNVMDANSIFARIYADLNHQAYVWIRDGGRPSGSK